VPWTLSADPEAYAARVWDLLAARPVRHTIALSILGMARKGHRWSEEPMLFGWYEAGGEVRGAVFQTPPYELGLAVLPAAATEPLVEALRAARHPVAGVSGAGLATERFAAAWSTATGARASTALRLCLHELGSLQPPDPAPAGRGRPAEERDLALAVGWYGAFQAETRSPGGGDAEAMARERIADGRLWLWEAGEGDPAALAAGRRRRSGSPASPPCTRRPSTGAGATARRSRRRAPRTRSRAATRRSSSSRTRRTRPRTRSTGSSASARWTRSASCASSPRASPPPPG